MRLSIIIPVYKVEKYIRDTLQSIYRQQYDENLFGLSRNLVGIRI